MSDIQQARDVLAKWKRDALRGPWEYRPIAPGRAAASPEPGAPVVNVVSGAAPDIRLIVGTAGNPDLLDALDEMLAVAIEVGERHKALASQAGLIAAAIVAADERMTS